MLPVKRGVWPYYIVDDIDSVSTEDWIPRVCNRRLKGAIEELRMVTM